MKEGSKATDILVNLDADNIMDGACMSRLPQPELEECKRHSTYQWIGDDNGLTGGGGGGGV